MPSKFDPSRILFRTPSDSELAYELATFAIEFALLGHVDTARYLMSLHNKYVHKHHRQSFRTGPLVRGLWLLWDITGIWPEGEEKAVREYNDRREKQEILAEIAEQFEGDRWRGAGLGGEEERVYDEAGLRRCVERLRQIERGDRTWKPSGPVFMYKTDILVKAFEIAIVLEDRGDSQAGEGLPGVEEILGWIAKELHDRDMMPYLAQSKKAWSLLKDGPLAKVLGVKDEKVRELGEKVLETFKIRCKKGVQRSDMWGKSVEKLVHIISDKTLNNEACKDDIIAIYGKDRYPTTLLKEPLPRTEITALEDRVGISLPDDYKEFLAATNGMGASFGGIIFDPPLFPASKVRWIDADEDYFTELAADILPDVYNLMREVVDHENWPKVGIPLQIGSEDRDNVWLLPPAEVKRLVAFYLGQRNGSAETRIAIENAMTPWAGSVKEFEDSNWWLMTWASGGSAVMKVYPSFKAYLVRKAEVSDTDQYSTKDPELVCFSYSCR